MKGSTYISSVYNESYLLHRIDPTKSRQTFTLFSKRWSSVYQVKLNIKTHSIILKERDMQSPIYKDKQEGKVGENVYLWNLEFGNIQSKEC